MKYYNMKIAGLDRALPLCKVTDDLYIGAFVIFGDPELTTACAEEMLKPIGTDCAFVGELIFDAYFNLFI